MMTIDAVRTICLALPNVTEDIKWGHDLCFLVGGKMFTVVSMEPPHSIGFKCTPEAFGELVERPGIIPAPYMARNMWVQEQELGEALDRRELEALIASSYQLVASKLPKRLQPTAAPAAKRVTKRAAKRSPRRATNRPAKLVYRSVSRVANSKKR
jgi:predicted DNA-binding protein (MmcQ/YjbR family)